MLSLPRLTRVGRRFLPLVAHILREDADLLTRWRARLTAAFLAAVATLGLLVAIPMVTVAVARGLWLLVCFDITALVGAYTLLFSRRVSNGARTVFLTAASFGLGVVSVVTRGPGSTVLGWLFMSVFLAAFLLGPRVTAGVVAASLAVLGGVAVAIAREWLPWALSNPHALDEWLLTSLNFAFLIVVFSIANGIIIQLLENEDRARTAAEQRLREARHNEALGTLAGGIAHDFNNLLVPMLANVEAVRARVLEGSDADRALRDAERSALRARALVQRILTFGHGMNAERTLCDPVQAACDAVELARLSAPASVRLAVEAVDAPAVHASDAELHQIVANLVTNAVHAVGDVGQVDVLIDAVVLSDVRWLRLRVRDDGAGMDAHTRERLFDPYFSTKAPGRGTGLGLPIVQSVVLSLGGHVRVESAPLAGSTFTVLLPAATGHADDWRNQSTESGPTPSAAALADDASREPVSDITSGTRVLLVDDEPSVRRAASRLLETLGCTVTSVESATDAVTLLETQADGFDVLVTDYRMPGMTGAELIAIAERVADRLPIVLISGHLDSARTGTSLPERVVLVAKPFSRQSLARAMASALTGYPSMR